MTVKPRRKAPNPDGNPLFKTEQHPAKLRQEGDEPANATLAIRIPNSLKAELKKIPNREIREWLWQLVKKEAHTEPEPGTNPVRKKQQKKSRSKTLKSS